MVKTVFFDLDDTLLDFASAESHALKKALTVFHLPAGEDVLARYHVINAAQWELLEEGRLTRDQVLTGRFCILLEELGKKGVPQEICDCYEEYLGQGHWFVPGAEALLQRLFPRYPLYLVTNGTARIQRRRLESAGIGRYFQKIFISQEVGHDKPSRAFFDCCFGAIPGFSRDTAVIVGDSLTSDIRGGKNAGIRTCWFNPKGRSLEKGVRPDYEIRSLEALPGLLDGI